MTRNREFPALNNPALIGVTRELRTDRIWAAKARRKRQIPYCDNLNLAVLNELVAQLVEQRPFKAWVLGSNPSELTIVI